MKRLILTALALFLLASPSQAVFNHSSISWTAPPATFVNSLYMGVLGRVPESPEVVASWASQVDSSQQSRLRVFWAFVNSAEHRGKFGSESGPYTIYYRVDRNRTNYAVAKQQPAGYHGALKGRFNYQVAMAIRDCYQAFNP